MKPVLTLTSEVELKNYSVDLSKPGKVQPLRRPSCRYFLQPHQYMPTDGIVKSKATEITKGAKTDVEKAQAIYDWIVDNTFRDPKVRGCGRGDIRFMLETGYLGGKCADLNALYVGLARAAGFRRAMYMAFAWRSLSWVTRVWVRRRRKSPRPSTAARKCT